MSDTLPRLNLDDARAVLGKMTPGPWANAEDGAIALPDGDEVSALCNRAGDPDCSQVNAEGIVYCVNNFGALIEEVAQLRAALTATVGEDGCVYGCGCHYASRRDEINEEKTHVGACALARAALSPAPIQEDK